MPEENIDTVIAEKISKKVFFLELKRNETGSSQAIEVSGFSKVYGICLYRGVEYDTIHF
jgi:hypothetical protein